jgi:probable phosphoglycerate mutase
MKNDSAVKNTTLFVVRHGETLWNQQGLLQGHLDSPLSELGVNQANALADYFSKCDWDLIVSSDLTRAVRTAEIIKRASDKQILTDKCLRERNLGVAQGFTVKEFGEKYHDESIEFNKGGADYIIPGGESIDQRFKRSITCINGLVERFKGNKIIIVTHGGVLDGIFRYTVKMPLNQKRTFSLFNASVNTIQIQDDSWNIVTWGYVEHLRALGSLDDWYRGAI